MADSYIDYEAFLDPAFTPAAFANTLVVATNDPNDAPLDLATPLARVLFDIQEVDSHIDLLTARAAAPLLQHTQAQTASSKELLAVLTPQVDALNVSYRQLEKQVLAKHAEADDVRRVALRLWDTLRVGQGVARALQVARQLELQAASLPQAAALVGCAHALVDLKDATADDALQAVDAVRELQAGLVASTERTVRDTADRLVKEFSLGDAQTQTFAQREATKNDTASALAALHTLDPVLMTASVESFLRAALQSSLTALARSLAALPTLERTLAETATRCRTIVALEGLLSDTFRAAVHAKLETASLASFFWRTLASHLSPRVQDIVTRGGVQARTLRSNRASVGDHLRACVLRGVDVDASDAAGAKAWEREMAVLVASVTGPLGR